MHFAAAVLGYHVEYKDLGHVYISIGPLFYVL
jgi:hypothetical protein